MLRKIKDLVHPPKPTKLPYGLKDSEYSKLKELVSHPHWKDYTSLLDTLATFLTEDMLSSSTTEAVMFYRSYIIGIRRAGTIVDEIIQNKEATDARSRPDPGRMARTAGERRNATYGTPFWDSSG